MRKRTIAALILACAAGAVFGLGSYTFIYAKGFSYLSKAPEACANCHIMQAQYDGWQKSSHHKAAVCIDCHIPHSFFAKYLTKAEDGLKHSAKFTLENFHEPIMIHDRSLRIVNNNCLYCHSSFVGPLAAHEAETGGDNRCTKCHARVGH